MQIGGQMGDLFWLKFRFVRKNTGGRIVMRGKTNGDVCIVNTLPQCDHTCKHYFDDPNHSIPNRSIVRQRARH